MELDTKEELNTLKKLIEETGNEETFKGTLESIENCNKLIEKENNLENES